MGRLRFLYLFLCLIFPANIFAEGLEVNVSVDTQTVLIGDQFNVSVWAKHTQGAFDVHLPDIHDTTLNGLELIESYPLDSSYDQDGDLVRFQKEYKITAFDSGTYQIAPLPFYISRDQDRDTLFSAPLKIRVQTVKLDTTQQIRDIKGPKNAPVSFMEILPWLLIILGVVLLVFLAWYLYNRRRKGKPLLGRVKPVEPAHQVALRELDKLDAEKLWQRDEVKMYYSRLTAIIRAYIEARFNIRALEQTTGETLREFKEKYPAHSLVVKGGLSLYDILEQLLTLADQVKFAKGLAMPDENQRHLEHAYSFVLTTKPVDDEQQDKSEKEDKHERS